MQAQVSENLHINAGTERGCFDVPLLTFGSDQAIVGKLEVLHHHADGETEMPTLKVGIWTVEKFVVEFGLCRLRKASNERRDGENRGGEAAESDIYLT